jgi:glycosyltransferase involved in cell wall biosynthesis
LDERTKISVIIPTFQEEKLAEKILSQFTGQLKKKHNIELIVSDGGSTDKTLEIAYRYADKVVENKEGKKQNISIGRNSGAKLAEGEILIFINADTEIEDIDIFFPTISNEIIQYDIIAVTCPVYVYPEEETLLDRLVHFIMNIYFYSLNILGMGMGRGECHILKKENFNKVQGYNEKIAAGEDFDLFHRLRKDGKISFLWKVKVFESPRRYRKEGYFRIIFLWLANAVSVLIFKKSILSEWKPVR